MSDVAILHGDALEVLRSLPSESVQCCVTSPPYWGLRDYGVDGQIGLESTPEEYVSRLVAVFREAHRVLRPDGVLWVEMGDGYVCDAGSGRQGKRGESANRRHTHAELGVRIASSQKLRVLKPKDLIGMPWELAFALRADGWYLRSDVIWHKLNPMPESVRDRPTRSPGYLFLLSKSPRYRYDMHAISEPASPDTHARTRGLSGQKSFPAAERNGMRALGVTPKAAARETGIRYNDSFAAAISVEVRPTRNARSVWSIASEPYKGSHFATFPSELPRRCILAGSRSGDTILDPFAGSGTTGAVARELGRKAILIELQPDYLPLIQRRLRAAQPPLLLDEGAA